jgi:hypothetical protein
MDTSSVTIGQKWHATGDYSKWLVSADVSQHANQPTIHLFKDSASGALRDSTQLQQTAGSGTRIPPWECRPRACRVVLAADIRGLVELLVTRP